LKGRESLGFQLYYLTMMITSVQAFDAYQGKGVDEGKKSLAIAVTFQPKDATLTDVEIDALSAKVVAAVEKATGGSLRG
ncbi:MAG: phenylalanine--tRNA ligase subunit beta-related protein, partial [Alphaproteobacteria bacterium]